MISPKFLKMAASAFCKSLSNAISKFIKNSLSNFTPVSILKAFSKIYEKVTKDWIDVAMNKYSTPFLSPY